MVQTTSTTSQEKEREKEREVSRAFYELSGREGRKKESP